MGSILVKDFRVSTAVGVTAEERSFPSLLTMQLEIHFNTRQAGVLDNIEETIDYDRMLQLLRGCCAEGSCKLLEALMLKCVGALFEEFSLLDQVDIQIEKFIFADTKSVSVKDCFKRSDT